MPEIRLRDYRMIYEDRGNGIPLVLIHGFPLNHLLWRPQLDGLSGIARIIAPDLRGHGQSEPLKGPYPMELLAQDCLELLDRLGIRQPVVIGGLSMGGYVAFAFYRQFPERVGALILAATRAGADTLEGKANREASARLASQQGVSAVIDGMLPKMMAPQAYRAHPELVQAAKEIMQATSVEGVIGAQLGMKDRLDSFPGLPAIDKPTLILHGADDQLVPVKEAEAMHAAIPHSQLQILPDAGHLLNLEQPQMFNQAVEGFLESLLRE